ncbi:MAG: hypothetical protein ABJR05_06705 [Balneola sp.]
MAILKNKILLQILLAGLVATIYFLYTNTNAKVETNTPRKGGYAETVYLEKKYESYKLPKSFFTVTRDINLGNNEKVLVFRFSELNCGSCVTREIRELRDFAKKYGWEQIIFLATNSDNEALETYKRVSGIKTEVYNINQHFFELDKELIDTPYMFIIDQDSIIKELFISMKQDPDRSVDYFNSISKYFE